MSNPILVVVESPAKQKTIAKILGPGYIVRATVGHIMDLAKSKEHRLGVDIDSGFVPKYSVIPDKKDKIAAIVDAANQSSEVYIASDPDREGEAIAWHVADQIKSTKKPIKRVMFKKITPQGIQQGIKSAGALDKNLYDSQQARRVLDRLVGFMVSPYLWKSLGPNLSAGRVQSVCLRLIVDREREIEAFVPEIYWAISATLAKTNKSEKFLAKYPTRITTEELASSIKDDLENSTFTIGNVESKEMLRNPPPPLTTSRLQQIGASRYKYPTKKTMSAAQGLYETGYVTYIRTDSTRSDPEAIAELRKFLTSKKFDIPKYPNEYKVKGTAQDAHEAIRPTDISLHPDNFVGSDDQSKIYRLIWEHFVASQMMPAIYDTVSVAVLAERAGTKKKHELKANGRTLKYAGWLAVLQDIESKKDDDVTLPILKTGEGVVLVPPKIQSDKKQTQPPPRYNEGSLVKELDKRGIGRPSTYAAIIGKISDRNYVTKSKNVFTPTDIGCKVIDDLTKHFQFMEYEYTKLMEIKLDKIEVGEVAYVQMLSDFFEPFKAELKSAQLSQDKDGGHDCDKCGKRMKLKHGKFGYYIACSGHPQCKNTKSVELDGEVINIKSGQELVSGVMCPTCNAGMVKRDGKFGPFYSCSTYPKCKGIKKVPFGKKCHKCGFDLFMTAFKGEPKLACMGYPNCKHVEEVPPGTKVNWLDPQTLKRKSNKKVDRILAK